MITLGGKNHYILPNKSSLNIKKNIFSKKGWEKYNILISIKKTKEIICTSAIMGSIPKIIMRN